MQSPFLSETPLKAEVRTQSSQGGRDIQYGLMQLLDLPFLKIKFPKLLTFLKVICDG